MGNIVLNKVTKSFGATTVIPGIDLDIKEGDSSCSSVPPAAASPPCCA